MNRYDLLIVNRSFWPVYPVIGEGLLRVAESFASSKKVAVIFQDHANINKHLKEFEEYRKYLKIFYSENSKCPVDSKTLLLKKETANEYEMWCKSKTSKDWKIIIKKPKVYNLNIKLNELNTIYKNNFI